MVHIAILYDRFRWEERAILKELSVKPSVNAEAINVLDLFIDLGDRRDNPAPDIYLQRAVSFYKGLYSTIALEAAGYRVVNDSKTSLTCGDKVLTTIALVKRGVPTPRTLLAFSESSALKAAEEVGYPAILKPVYGSWGRLVAPLKDPLSAKALIEARIHLHPIYHVFYIQEMVRRPPRDIRTFVVGQEVVAGIYRLQPEGEWRTNTHLGGKAVPCKLTDEIVELSLRAAEAVGGGILGVDMMEGPEGLLIHEVNHVVEFRNTVRVTGIPVHRYIADYIVREVRR
jgi:[lysine-biosynthesis-protein LysW]--L-2-aminoadipate ligase